MRRRIVMNKCYVFIGPSGSGKTSLASELFEPNQKIITYTTRHPRKGERDQIDYYFVTESQFEQMIKNDAFVEWDEYAGEKYGSSKAEVMHKLEQGDCYIILTAAGFWSFYHTFGSCIQPVFVKISKKQLKERFLKRGDTQEQIQKRLALFEKDMQEITLLERVPQLMILTNNNDLEKTKKQFINQQKKEEEN